jgi:hypothetical protein
MTYLARNTVKLSHTPPPPTRKPTHLQYLVRPVLVTVLNTYALPVEVDYRLLTALPIQYICTGRVESKLQNLYYSFE